MMILKRIGLFILTNLAVVIVAGIILSLVQIFFKINVTAYGFNYIGLFIFALIYGFVGATISLFLSKWIAKRTYNIQIFDPNNLHELSNNEKVVYDIIREISNRHGIKMPEVGVYQSPEANAFATGATKNSSLVAVSSGLLDKMNHNEIEGVIAHEMTHILNGDMVTMTLLQGILNTFVIFFARIIANVVDSAFRKDNEGPSVMYFVITMVMELILGILASIIAMWFSRYREFRADEGSATFVGKEKMIAALKSLQRMYEFTPTDTENGKMAAFQISSKTSATFNLFASHPPLEARIQNLESFKIM